MRRLLVSTVAFLLLLLALTACEPEQIDVFVLLNEERAAVGLPMLDVSPEAAVRAQAWAEHLASVDRIYHSHAWLDGNWWIVGENVGRGNSVDHVHQALMASPSHRANILRPEFTHAGIGTVWDGDVLYVVQVFAG